MADNKMAENIPAEDPLLYETIVKHRVGPAVVRFAETLLPPKTVIENRALHLVIDAYRAGLVDGFAQGVAAECRKRDNRPANEFDEHKLAVEFRSYIGRCASLGYDTMIRLLDAHFQAIHAELHGQDFTSAVTECAKTMETLGDKTMVARHVAGRDVAIPSDVTFLDAWAATECPNHPDPPDAPRPILTCPFCAIGELLGYLRGIGTALSLGPEASIGLIIDGALGLTERLAAEVTARQNAECAGDEARIDRDTAEATLATAVSRLGGFVEGHPTHRLNFLQRIEELREIEREHRGTKKGRS